MIAGFLFILNFESEYSIVSASIITVDDTGGADYSTIQQAIDNASAGDTIYIWAGIYYERIIINKAIILIGNGTINTTIDGKKNGDVVIITSDWVKITGLTISNASTNEWYQDCDTFAGIKLDNVENVHVYDVNCSNNYYGIRIKNSKNNTIENNRINQNWEGIVSSYSDNNIIRNNTVNMNWFGIGLGRSDFNAIINNNVSNINTIYSNLNVIANNTLNAQTKGWGGIKLWDSNSTKVKNNTMIFCGLEITGDLVSYWNTHSIDTKNTVNGKPFYYWKNIDGGKIPLGAGQIILANCTNILVENQTINNGKYGIQLGFSSKNILKNNNCNNHSDNGILLFHSNLNIIINNNCSNNYYGIFIEESNSNSFINNTCNMNRDGFYIQHSKLNTFIRNICLINRRSGIFFANSNSNIITNNTFNFNNFSGISNLYSDSNYYSQNICLYNENGIYLPGSNLNTFINNNCSNNNRGIFIENMYGYSNQNIIEKNNISNNLIGISFGSNSNNNSIIYNIIFNNSDIGLFIEDDSNNNNIIYHNQFIFNKKQAIDIGNNFWNNSNREGNYWSDYFGLDNGYGGRVVGNGIGDTNIPHLGFDFYPFIEPNGWLVENRTVENQTGNINENDTKEENDHLSVDKSDQDSIDIIFLIRIIVILLVIILMIIVLIKNRKKKSKINKEKKEKNNSKRSRAGN